MSDIAIRVENLSKKYKIGANQARYQTLRESIVNGFSNPIERIIGSPTKDDNIIWALKDINFEVKHGEVLGIIGRNGAGKSTLLKILSRITKPTTGRFELNGRVGSLLEVGTGFHPELTGRENIYLSGAILGMKRKEINRKFDEIVDFAEIEKFLDTPVKHYSSGMYMRLAFSVAAHLEPEILLVDEVLAVGDAEFQKKCLGKMGDVAGEGRTVLFVSHNMGAIKNLCKNSIWINFGSINEIGETEQIIADYLILTSSSSSEVRFSEGLVYKNNDKFKLLGIRIIDEKEQTSSVIDITKPFFVEIEYIITKKVAPMRVFFVLSTVEGDDVFTSVDSSSTNWGNNFRDSGVYRSKCKVPGNLLQPGNYLIRIGADIPFIEVLFQSENLLSFQILQIGGVSGRYLERWSGIICPELEWKINKVKNY
jgi:lipopolysaccharide transport system ATP-binding protein